MVTLCIPGIRARSDILLEILRRAVNQRRRIAVLANEFCRRHKAQVEQIVQHQHLAIALWPGANADGRNGQLGGDHGAHLPRHAFQHHAEAARALHCDGIAHELLDGGQRFALHLIAAHGVQRLRRKPDVSHDRNFRVAQAHDQLAALLSALDLHRLGAGFLDKPRGVAHRFVSGQMVRAIGHVGNEQRALGSAPGCAGVVQHLIHAHRHGVLVAQHHHGQRVAHQDHVNAGLIHQARGGIVVGGQASDALAPLLFLLDCLDGYLRARLARIFTNRGGDAHVASSAVPPLAGYSLYCSVSG